MKKIKEQGTFRQAGNPDYYTKMAKWSVNCALTQMIIFNVGYHMYLECLFINTSHSILWILGCQHPIQTGNFEIIPDPAASHELLSVCVCVAASQFLWLHAKYYLVEIRRHGINSFIVWWNWWQELWTSKRKTSLKFYQIPENTSPYMLAKQKKTLGRGIDFT